MQEFIEIVRQNRMVDAIMYARKHLAPWAQAHLRDLQQALAVLAFKPQVHPTLAIVRQPRLGRRLSASCGKLQGPAGCQFSEPRLLATQAVAADA